MPPADDRQAVVAVVCALRWVAVVIGCVFAADTAVDGQVRGVLAVGLGVLVAVWWTLRPQLVHVGQDIIAAAVLVVADITSDQIGAFIPAVIMALIPIAGRRWLPEPEPVGGTVDIDAALRQAG